VDYVAISPGNPVGLVTGPHHVQRPQPTKVQTPAKSLGSSFNEILKQKVDGVKEVLFSAHARDRLIQRNIQLTRHDMERINGGIQKAENKGARESLVLLNELALVVSVPNRTVITAMSGDTLQGNIFTQIDSAVIV
jgi:flagellar operon protein